MKKTMTLFRPVGPNELAKIKKLYWKAFPDRLPEQPLFYPVLNREYAAQIAREWNLPASGSGFVTQFEVELDFAKRYEVHNVGGKIHNELWVPAEELAEFNRRIVGDIQVVDEFYSAES